MEVMVETCCGIDVHQKSIVCCILDGPLDTSRPKKYSQSFGTSTPQQREALECLHGKYGAILDPRIQYFF